MFKDIISLIGTRPGENELGDPIKIPYERIGIFADKKSVMRNEFYQAAAVGLKPVYVFEVRLIEYEGELLLGFENKTYTIIRTFETKNECIELTCEGGVNSAIT